MAKSLTRYSYFSLNYLRKGDRILRTDDLKDKELLRLIRQLHDYCISKNYHFSAGVIDNDRKFKCWGLNDVVAVTKLMVLHLKNYKVNLKKLLKDIRKKADLN